MAEGVSLPPQFLYMKKLVSAILIVLIVLVMLVGLYIIIPIDLHAYASDINGVSYYLNAQAVFDAVNQGQEGIVLLTCVDEYGNEIYLSAVTLAEMGFDNVGVCIIFPESMETYYCSCELAIPDIELYISQGYSDLVDISNGELTIPYNVTNYDDTYISTTAFDYSSGIPVFVEELSESDITFTGFISPFVDLIYAFVPISQDIFNLFYADGAFTPVGIVFIFIIGFGFALLIFNIVAKLWGFNE